MGNTEGKLIVLYGANNLGKSTQLELLEKDLTGRHVPFERIKYPRYQLEPTGPQINAVLRQGVPMSDLDLQILFAQNRRDFEPELMKLLKDRHIIAEDYIGTGLAWGVTKGVPLDTLETVNADLRSADVSILLHGKRFSTGHETGHRNESDAAIWEKANKTHVELANRYGWQKVNANQEIEAVRKEIQKIVFAAIGLKK
jgi:thymidylate kinase